MNFDFVRSHSTSAPLFKRDAHRQSIFWVQKQHQIRISNIESFKKKNKKKDI
jgi:hypothetical protein